MLVSCSWERLQQSPEIVPVCYSNQVKSKSNNLLPRSESRITTRNNNNFFTPVVEFPDITWKENLPWKSRQEDRGGEHSPSACETQLARRGLQPIHQPHTQSRVWTRQNPVAKPFAATPKPALSWNVYAEGFVFLVAFQSCRPAVRKNTACIATEEGL